MAHVLRDGVETDVPTGHVQVGDVLVVRPGERVPVDGRVTEGTSAVDQSALTGESLPIDKAQGDEVFTGTLNQFGALTMVAEKVGGDTTLAQVVKLVAEATERKAPLERTADRLARLFLPVVLAVAGITLVVWRIKTGEWNPGFLPALSVLVVACPCPLILATPSAVMAAMAWLARTGVVVKGSAALERLAGIDTFVFDKTGTLTRGELALGDLFAFEPLDEDELIRVAAIAERRSEHLLARLIVREAESRNMVVPAVDQFLAHPGSGITAQVRATMLGPWAYPEPEEETKGGEDDLFQQMCEVVVGNRRLLETKSIDISAEAELRLEELDETGQTVLLVAVDGKVLGAIGVRDTIRAETRDVINQLKAAGIDNFALLTGDRQQPAQTVARTLGLIDHVEAEMLPLDKANWIESQTKQGRCVAMVGDGVNDAPALATATVGLALGGVGSDIAAEAGDLVLMGDPLHPLPGLLRLSRQLVRIIRQSIWLFAFGMNGLGMLLGAVGLLPPAAAAVFHECASLAVMLNALRLLWFERWEETRAGQMTRSVSELMHWLADLFSPTQLVFRFIDHCALFLRLAVAVAGLWWCLSGIVLLSEDERAVVTRFGKYEETLSAGLHWRWPVGLERIVRERVDEVRTVQLGFRASGVVGSSTGTVVPPIEWTTEHAGTDYQPMPSEALLLTGDEVPIEVTGEVDYRISDLYQYVYGSAAPEETLRAVAESAIRRVAAQYSLDGALTDQREVVERQCLALIQTIVGQYDLGVEVCDLNLLDIHPPKQVVPAYRQVADALEEREQLINEAEAYYARKVLNAAGERAIRLLSLSVHQKDVSRASATTGGVAGWKLDDQLWEQLIAESEEGHIVLSGEAAATLLDARQRNVQKVQAALGKAARFNSLLSAYQFDRFLTGLQLYWNTIDQALSSRPVTIIDPKVAGKQHLLLADPLMLGNVNSLQSTFPTRGEEPPYTAPPLNEE